MNGGLYKNTYRRNMEGTQNTNDMGTMRRMAIVAFVCGISCVVFYLLHDIIGSMNHPDYNFMSQAVSDLSATDAPSFAIASGLSSVYGICACVCCILMCFLVKNESRDLRVGVYLFTLMQIVSAVGYSIFPLSSDGYDGSFQSFMHVYVVTVAVVLLSVSSLLVISVAGFRGGRKFISILAIAALCLMVFGAIGTSIFPADYFGLIERFSTYSAVLFTASLGGFGLIILTDLRKGES